MKLRLIIFLTVAGFGLLPLLTLIAVNLRGHLARHEQVAAEELASRAGQNQGQAEAGITRLRASLERAAERAAARAAATRTDASFLPLLQEWFDPDPAVRGLEFTPSGGRERSRLGRAQPGAPLLPAAAGESTPAAPFLTATLPGEPPGMLRLELDPGALLAASPGISWAQGATFPREENPQLAIAWTPLALDPGQENTLWLGTASNRLAARQWQSSLIRNIGEIVLATMLVVFALAHLLAAKIERLRLAIVSGVERIINNEEEVVFAWRGPAELQTLAADLTALGRRYAATRAEHRQAVAESQRQLQRVIQNDKMRSLGLLVSGVAHELNNPNSIVLLNTPRLAKAWQQITPILEEYYREQGDFMIAGLEYSQLGPEIPRLFQEVEESSRRIKQIVKDLKEYARQEGSRELELVELNEVVATAVRLTRNLLKETGASLAFFPAPSLPAIHAHRQRLSQVAINLIQNSCEALDGQPGGTITVTTRSNPEAGTVELAVADNGPGMAAGELAQITDPFYTTKRQQGGTGLGLSVSAGIIQEHRGQLHFQSTPGEGTLAVVSLPLPHEVPHD